jgi:hypothetical protein
MLETLQNQQDLWYSRYGTCSNNITGTKEYLAVFHIGTTVESLQSHFILTMSHWSSRLPVYFPSQWTQVQIPGGGTYVKPGLSC